MGKEFLTADQLKQLWPNEFLPDIRKENNEKLTQINALIRRFQQIEQPQSLKLPISKERCSYREV